MTTNIKPIVIIRIPDEYDEETFEMINEEFQNELSENYHVVSISSSEVTEVKLEIHDRNIDQNLN